MNKFNHKSNDFCEALGIDIDEMQKVGTGIINAVFSPDSRMESKRSKCAEKIYDTIKGCDHVLLSALFLSLLRTVADASPVAALVAGIKNGGGGLSIKKIESTDGVKTLNDLLERIRSSAEEQPKEEKAKKLSDIRKPKEDEPEGGSMEGGSSFK